VAGKGMTEVVGTATIAAIGTMTAVVMMVEETTEVDVEITTVAMATVKQLQKSGALSAAFFCPGKLHLLLGSSRNPPTVLFLRIC